MSKAGSATYVVYSQGSKHYFALYSASSKISEWSTKFLIDEHCDVNRDLYEFQFANGTKHSFKHNLTSRSKKNLRFHMAMQTRF